MNKSTRLDLIKTATSNANANGEREQRIYDVYTQIVDQQDDIVILKTRLNETQEAIALKEAKANLTDLWEALGKSILDAQEHKNQLSIAFTKNEEGERSLKETSLSIYKEPSAN